MQLHCNCQGYPPFLGKFLGPSPRNSILEVPTPPPFNKGEGGGGGSNYDA